MPTAINHPPAANANTPPAFAPISMSIPDAIAMTGLSRSCIYRAARDRKVIFRKIGRSTIVDAASLAAFVANLPVAQLGRDTEEAA